MAKALVGLYATLVLALLAAAVGIWRLHCEGFGCMGIGVAWFAWVVSFFVVLGVGLLARSRVTSPGGLAHVGRIAWWLQLAAGAALVVVWLSKHAA